MENSSEIPAEEPQSVADTLRVELAAANARIAVLENDLARLNDTKTPVPVSADRRSRDRHLLRRRICQGGKLQPVVSRLSNSTR